MRLRNKKDMTRRKFFDLTPFENGIEASSYFLQKAIKYAELGWSWGIYSPSFLCLIVWDFLGFMEEAVYDDSYSCLIVHHD